MTKEEKLRAKLEQVYKLMEELQISHAAKLRFDENGWVPLIAYYDNEKYMDEETLPEDNSVELDSAVEEAPAEEVAE